MTPPNRTHAANRGSAWPLLVLVVLVLLLAGYGAVRWRDTLPVRSILVTGMRIVDPHEVITLSGVRGGDRLYAVNLGEVKRRVALHPFFDEVIVRRQIPGTLTIDVVERRPCALISAGELYAVDRSGVLLPLRNNEAVRASGTPHATPMEFFDLPVLSGIRVSQPIEFGRKVGDPNLGDLLKIVELLQAENQPLFHRISELSIAPEGGIVLFTADESVPIRLGRGGIPRKVVELEAFWEKVVAREGLWNLEYIDLQYEDQVVVKAVANGTASRDSINAPGA